MRNQLGKLGLPAFEFGHFSPRYRQEASHPPILKNQFLSKAGSELKQRVGLARVFRTLQPKLFLLFQAVASLLLAALEVGVPLDALIFQ